MKKLLLIAVSTIMTGVVVVGTNVYAQQTQPGTAPEVEKTNTQRLAGETIDNVTVPFDVLTAIQMYFEGYAVTHANEIQRNGQKAYRLQVGRDDINKTADTFYLVFDSKWDFIGREAYIAPPKPAPRPVEQPKDEKKEEKKPEKPVETTGGQGAGDGTTTTETDKPIEPSTEPTTDSGTTNP